LFARLGESIAKARLRDRPLAVCMVYMDGLHQLGKVLDFGIIEQISATLLRGATALLTEVPSGYVDRLAENILLFVIDHFEDREALQGWSGRLLKFLGQPVAVGDATLSATPSAGLALLGSDGTEARQLLESARFAMLEARRSGSSAARFYSADLQLRSLARLDIEHELREAIAQDHLALRYNARHCLESGRLVAIHAHLGWTHPVRGEVAAAEFLPIADSTGLATPLSRWALTRLQRDIASFRRKGAHPIRFSFGPLKSHLSSGHLRDDIEVLFASGAIAPEDLEVRITERTLAGLADAGSLMRSLTDLGTTIAVDEFGRGFTSLPRLARLPISALQLDRRLALAASADPAARRAAAAAFAAAKALELVARSAGVDDEPQRCLLNSLGCTEGLGDNFAAVSSAGSDDIGRRRRTA
jgi:predicted signal transduction protein with EAL and GGDEF domain